jgi:hypothetical protein
LRLIVCRAVADEIRDEAAVAPALKAVRLLALYFGGSREAAVAGIEAALADGHSASDATVQAVAAQVFINEGNHQAALKALRSPQGLEHMALLCQLHLRIDRPDLAEKSLKAMQAIDDEAALTTLSAAQIALALVRTAEKCAKLQPPPELFTMPPLSRPPPSSCHRR